LPEQSIEECLTGCALLVRKGSVFRLPFGDSREPFADAQSMLGT
jgi:hypothetical protein